MDRIVRICDDLRRFSRDEKPEFKPFEPDEPLRNSHRLLERQLRLGNIELKQEITQTPATVMGDKHQLEQVFFNLVKNAMEAMPEGGSLTIASRAVAEDGEWWECRVADTGEGISKETMNKIFDPFFTTKPEDKGTGLGLAVTQSIVDAFGGKLWAESPPGQGATFIVRLPLVKN